MFRTTYSIGAVFIALSLSACGAVTEPPQSIIKNKGFSKVAVEASKTPGPQKTDAKPMASYIQPKTKIVYPPLSQLTGMSRFQVIELLGLPGFQRQDHQALFWQYKSDFCVLDVFLYRSGERSQYQVNHFETRPSNKDSIKAKDCFIVLLKTQKKRHSG